MWYLFLFFFFKQKTAYESSVCESSADVCASDLTGVEREREKGGRQSRQRKGEGQKEEEWREEGET